MNFAQQTSQDSAAAANQFDGAEYIVRVLEGGVVIYEELDEIVLDLDF
jgi:hypothetical protein